RGVVIAVMDIEDIYKYSKRDFAKRLYGTVDKAHPGVDKVCSMGDYLIGGKINLVNTPHYIFEKYTLSPEQTRKKFSSLGWDKVVAFQTRNVPHLGHEYVQKTALSYVDGLFINPVIGKKKPGDFKDRVIMDSYEALTRNYYPKDRVFLSVLQMEMRYAGPCEAIHHAIIRKNFGCTHIIIGRDHAGVGSFYHPFAAHKIFDEFPDLEIKPIFFRSFFWCNHCGGVANDKTCAHSGGDIENFSGTNIRGMLQSGKVPSGKFMRPEVAKCIIKHKNPFV
ncbi:MAG: sulfate adenylyltransferase, partial [Candidatus Omnitrophica bacterium]|nr:sulfate adenylyltransferase [Candidatus Omnitrophota bacterium]